jgi:hypothetical protein
MGLFDRLKKKQPETQLVPTVENKPQKVPEITQILNGKRYSSLDAKCIAQGMSGFLYTWLMQTNKNNFFLIQSFFGATVQLTPIEQPLALQFHAALAFHEVPFEKAFPDVEVTDA